MLAGEPPFDGDSAQSILMKQATADPTPIREHRSDVPAPLATAVARMLAKDPAGRYQTAGGGSGGPVEAGSPAPRGAGGGGARLPPRGGQPPHGGRLLPG